MPREKAVPTRRTVHQFHEERIERQPAIDDHDAKGINDIDLRDGDDDDDDGADIEDNDHNIEKHVQSYGRWKTEPNEMDQKRSFSLEGSSSDSISDEVIMFHHHISVNLHRDILNNLDAVERLGLFCEGQHLVIEAVDGPSLDGFSCRALFPCSLLRAVRRDVCQGGLNLRVLCWDKDGFNVQVSVNLTSETMISATSMEWLLSSLSTKLSATDSSHRVRVGSNNCRADDIVSEMPTWFTPFSEEFCTEAFLETASAFQTSLSTTSSSLICGSGLSMLSELGQELKNGGLTTALRSYQLEGVHWLLKKLSCSRDDGEICNFSLSDDACGRCDGWVQLPYHCNQSRDRGALRQRQGSLTIGTAASSGSDTSQQTGGIRRLWYNLISERLTSELPPHPGSGSMAAVLADEMGIGKSIQVLSLVLLMKLRGEGKGDREESTLIESVDTQGTLSENKTELVAEKLLYSNNDGSLKIPDSIDPHDSTAERKRKRKGENLSDFPCLCNRRSEKKQDMGWVECSDCMRWLHVKCCGFSSAVEASREENFKCLACSCLHYSSRGSVEGERGGRVSSSATLILMPATLVSQWRNEIHKHFESRLSAFPSSSPLPPSRFEDQATSNLSADALLKHSPLRVFVYEGCDDLTLRRKGLSFTDVDPRNLASKYDIVFMSLKTLTKEFHQAQNATLSAGQAAERVSRRHGLGSGMKVSLDPCEGAGTTVSNNWGNKLYVSFPPPFMCIHWAMVVVDETQKIESESISQSLFLCKQLSARRRLCVTGTPLGSNRSSDLHSLCQYLHVSPYGHLGKRDWLGVFGERSLIRNERIRNRWLVDLFAPMVLRRTKRSVAEQLGLESPITTVRLIDFSGFETALYQEKLKPIVSAVTALEQDGDITDAKAKLEVLRKGCCHPQVWDKDMARKKKEGQRQHSHVARPFGEIMVLKVEQSRLMCEERQRELVFNLNSLAGVAILQAYIISMNRDREISGAAASGTTNYDVSSDEIVTDFSSPSRHDAISRGSDFHISSSVNSKVSALDYLRRALRAFTCAYSLLERNRGTCPLVGLLRVSGTPNTVFSVSRVVEEERNWGEAVDEIEDNLVDTELCADALCFTWSGQMNKNEKGMEIMTIEEVKEPSPLVRSDEGNKDPGSLPSPDVPPAVSASTIFSNPPGLCSQLESFSIVSAKMAFGVGRRLQQLKVRSALRSVVSTLKAKLLGSKVNGVGSIKESVVMVFPKEVALLAATGTSDTFTRVTLCEISLPTLIESEATTDGCHYPLAGFADSFPIRGSATLTADIMKNFPLSFRARSWRLDVLTLHGWCLEIEVARMGHGIEGSEGCLLLEGVGKRSRDIDTTLQVTGQWRRLDDLTPVFQSGTSTTLREMTAPSQVQMGLEIQVLEATFDIDLFQELHICSNIPVVARLLQQEGESISEISALIDQSMRKSDLEDFLRSMAHTASVLNPQPTVAAVHPTLTLPLSPPKSSTACTLPFLADDIYTPHPSSLQTLSCPSSSVKPLRPFNLFSCSTNTYRGGDGDGPNDSASKGISTARRSLEEGLTAGSSNLAASSSSIPESGLIKVIEQRAAQIEKDHVSGAQAMRTTAQHKMEDVMADSDRLENELLDALNPKDVEEATAQHYLKSHPSSSQKNRKWWVPLLLRMESEKNLSSLLSLQSTIEQGKDAYSRFKSFRDIKGLILLISIEFEELQTARHQAIRSLSKLSLMPSANEILLASNCQRCRAYFNKTGPVCAHCRLEELIIAYRLKLVAFKSKRKVLVSLSNVTENATGAAVKSNSKAARSKDGGKRSRKGGETGINTSTGMMLGSGSRSVATDGDGDGDAFDVQNFDMEMVEGAFCMIVKHLRAYAVRFSNSVALHEDDREDLQVLRDAAVSECQRCESMRKEVLTMTGLWQRYMALLKVHDEVDQGRRRIGLVDESAGNDVLTGNNLYGYELSVRYQIDYHQATDREVMLREAIGQLAFYKNQEKEARCRLLLARKQRARQREAAVTMTDKIDLKSTPTASLDVNAPSLNASEQDEDDLTCVFCRESLSESVPQGQGLGVQEGSESARRAATLPEERVVCLPCAHSFHKTCIRRWLQMHRACPVCKRGAVLDDCVPVDMTEGASNRNVKKLRALQSPIVSMTSPLSPTINFSQPSDIAQGTVLNEIEMDSDVEVKGQWGSKIDALVADLLRLLVKGGDTGQGEKVIVFSQWVEMLEIVSEALQANSICYSLCTDRSRDFTECGPLERFKLDMDTRVLLLPLHLGAEGLDLVQASHLFLLEPLLNSALESQAVNRIHRIGQTRTTYVHKFAVRGTVEELILRGQQMKLFPESIDLGATLHKDVLSPNSGRKKSKVLSKKDQGLITLQNIHFLLGISES